AAPSFSEFAAPFSVGASPGAYQIDYFSLDSLNNAELTHSLVVTLVDECLQDDASGDTLLFDSRTGAYQFASCSGGTSLRGTGTGQVRGNTLMLVHNTQDGRVRVTLETSQNRGTAVVQTFNPVEVRSITDRNTTDNTCGCR